MSRLSSTTNSATPKPPSSSSCRPRHRRHPSPYRRQRSKVTRPAAPQVTGKAPPSPHRRTRRTPRGRLRRIALPARVSVAPDTVNHRHSAHRGRSTSPLSLHCWLPTDVVEARSGNSLRCPIQRIRGHRRLQCALELRVVKGLQFSPCPNRARRKTSRKKMSWPTPSSTRLRESTPWHAARVGRSAPCTYQPVSRVGYG